MKLKIISVLLVILVSASWFAFKRHVELSMEWPPACASGTLTSYDLGDGVQLLERGCASGAYQGSYAYVLLEKGHAQLLNFPLYDSYEVWGLPYYDETTRELTITYQDSGSAPCRALRVYRFESSQPQLVREEPLCIQE